MRLCLSSSVFRLFSFLPQPPGGTADPTQHALELKEAWASLGSKTQKREALLPGRIGECRLFAAPQRLSVRAQEHSAASWIGWIASCAAI